MENARRFVPPTAEFKRPTSRVPGKKRDHLQVVDTNFEVPAPDITTAPALEAANLNVNKEHKAVAPTSESIATPKNALDQELERLATWPPHPNVKLANRIIIERNVAERYLDNLGKYDDPEYEADNRPDEKKLDAEKERLQEKITSLSSALELIIEPALEEAEKLEEFIKNVRNKLTPSTIDREKDSGLITKNITKNPNFDVNLRRRFISLSNENSQTQLGQIGSRLNYILADDHEYMENLIQEIRKNKTQPRHEPLQPVRTITRPNLKLVPNPEPEPSLGNKISGFFKKVTGIFRKAA